MDGLIVSGICWAVVLTVLLLDLSGLKRRGSYLRWQATGLLLGITGILADQLADQRGWRFSQLHAVHLGALLGALAGVGLFVVGILIQVRMRQTPTS